MAEYPPPSCVPQATVTKHLTISSCQETLVQHLVDLVFSPPIWQWVLREHWGGSKSLTGFGRNTSVSIQLGLAITVPNLEQKAMAPHSSTLAWKIPWTEESGGLQSMGSLGVGHDWVTSLSLFTFMLWRRKWQPTPVFLPGESQGRWILVGCRLWGRTESDTTEAT